MCLDMLYGIALFCHCHIVQILPSQSGHPSRCYSCPHLHRLMGPTTEPNPEVSARGASGSNTSSSAPVASRNSCFKTAKHVSQQRRVAYSVEKRMCSSLCLQCYKPAVAGGDTHTHVVQVTAMQPRRTQPKPPWKRPFARAAMLRPAPYCRLLRSRCRLRAQGVCTGELAVVCCSVKRKGIRSVRA